MYSFLSFFFSHLFCSVLVCLLVFCLSVCLIIYLFIYLYIYIYLFIYFISFFPPSLIAQRATHGCTGIVRVQEYDTFENTHNRPMKHRVPN